MLYYYLVRPYSSKYYYLLSGIDRVVKRTRRGVSRVHWAFRNPKIDRETFESPRSQCPEEGENMFSSENFQLNSTQEHSHHLD